MPEDEFEFYLDLLAKTLNLSDEQRRSVAAELRDHMEQRLDELTAQGMPRDKAIGVALGEFGDASELAQDLTRTNPVRRRRRRHLMQTSFGTIAACAAVTFAVMLLTPNNKNGQPTQPGAVAQDTAPDASGDPLDEERQRLIEERQRMIEERERLAEAERQRALAYEQQQQDQPVPVLEVIDCTQIIRSGSNNGETWARMQQLAGALTQSVNALTNNLSNSQRMLRVAPFDTYLIITATEHELELAKQILSELESAARAHKLDSQNRNVHLLQQRERAAIRIREAEQVIAEARRMQEQLIAQGRTEDHPAFSELEARIEEQNRVLIDARTDLEMIEQDLQD